MQNNKENVVSNGGREKSRDLQDYKKFFDRLPIGLFISTPSGEILDVNPALIDILGFPDKETLLNRSAYSGYLNQGVREDWMASIERLGVVSGFEYEWRCFDGTFIWIEESAKAIKDEHGNVLYYEGSVVDITRRKSAERALHNAYSQIRHLLASMTSLVISLDEHFIITNWNNRAEVLLGVAESETVGCSLATADIRWDYRGILDALEACRETKAIVKVDNLHYLSSSGRERLLEITIQPFLTNPGVADGYIIMGADITDRQVEEAHRAQAIKLEAIGRLAAGIAHEINTPTQFVFNNFSFLQDSFGELLPILERLDDLIGCVRTKAPIHQLVAELDESIQTADLEYLLEEIPAAIQGSKKGLERITRIVQAMRQFAHPGVGEKIHIDLNESIKSTIEVSRNEWKYSAEMIMDFDPDLPKVDCYPGEINQVVLNLIVNAAHAIQDKFAGNQGMGTITVRTRYIDDDVELRVIDTGSGIAEKHLQYIFDPFFTTKEVGRGTGQGLMIAYDIVVHKHGGTIRVETEEGVGTTFIVRFPIHADA